MGKCVTCDDEPTPFVLDVRLLASCSRMQLLDEHRLRYGESFHGNVVQFAVFASGEHSAIVLVTRMKIALGCIGELSCEFSPGKG